MSLSFSQTQIGSDINGENMGDLSGFSTSMNAEGNIIAIGSPYNDNNGINSGQVRIYKNQSGNWTQIGNDIYGTSSSGILGYSVSLNDEGNIVVIGAPDHTEPSMFEVGQVKVFENQSGIWTQIGEDITGEAFSDHSGYSVSINGEGNIVAIGAPDNEGLNGGNYGHVRVYQYQNDSWVQLGNDIDGEEQEDNSGFAISLNTEGDIVAIGAQNSNDSFMGAGHVRIYQFQDDNWVQIGNDIDGDAPNDKLGSSVSLSNDGNRIVIGAIDHNGKGQVKAFEFQGTDWIQLGNDMLGTVSGEDFGVSVALNGEGNIIAIGANRNSDSISGAGQIKLFQLQENNWVQIGNSINGKKNDERFGTSVTCNNLGDVVAGGAYSNDSIGTNSGAVRVFENNAIISPPLENTHLSLSQTILYPNCADDLINIQFNQTVSKIQIEILNSMGKTLTNKKHTVSDFVQIDVKNYPKGFYFVTITSEKEKTSIKFVKL